MRWIVTVTNKGAVPLSNVAVSDTLVDGLRVDHVETPKGAVNISGQNVTVSFATLNPGESVQFSIFTTVLDGVNVMNTACMQADNASSVCSTSSAITSLPNTGETPRWVYFARVLGLGIFAVISLGIYRNIRKSMFFKTFYRF